MHAPTLAARRPAVRGFTLIEAMITVAILAVLAAIAYPSYNSYIRKSKRATAQTALLDLANKEQTYLLDRRSYTTDTSNAGLQFVVPQEITSDYSFTVTLPTATTYVLTATPISTLMKNGGAEQAMTLASDGTKSPASYWTR